MQEVLLYEKTGTRTYRHFSIPPAVTPAAKPKPEFFYVGNNSDAVTRLVESFESGFTAETTSQAQDMLKKITSRSLAKPDLIIAEANIGLSQLRAFSAFLSSHPVLADAAFFIEGAGASREDLEQIAEMAMADDVILLDGMSNEKLIAKMSFWKRVKAACNTIASNGKLEPSAPPTSSEIAKRAFDIIISALLMVVLSPLFLLIMVALRLESKGPVFYISKRAGKGYRIFNFYKFRTMEVEANKKISDVSHLNLYNPLKANGPVFIKIDNDPRVTKLGAFLRKCSLDELPQLLNVFKGDMSLVGNRPLPLYEAASLTTDHWSKRFLAPAGMTGLWQIRRKTKYKMTAEERIRLDIRYAEKSNFLFDMWIMAKTPSAIIQRTNA